MNSNQDIGVKFNYSVDKGSEVAKHWHSSLEIIYIITGTLIVNVNGITYNLGARDIIVVNSSEIHSTLCKNGNTAFMLQIPYQFCEKYIEDISIIKFNCNSVVFKEDEVSLNQLRNTLFEFFSTYKTKELGYQLKINSLIFNLLFILVNRFGVKCENLHTNKSDKYLKRLTLITEYVKKHYDEHLTLEFVAQKFYLNPEYFSRFFRRYMGTTFIKYLNNIRLEQVYMELVNTDRNIDEIITKNGFTNYKTFIKLFKQEYGCSPDKKRRQLKACNNNKYELNAN